MGDLVDDERPIGIPVKYIYDHVFLPPKLPQAADVNVQKEVALTHEFHDALNNFIGLLPENVQGDWRALPNMLNILLDDGNLGSPMRNLSRRLKDMKERGKYFAVDRVPANFMHRCPRSSYNGTKCRPSCS